MNTPNPAKERSRRVSLFQVTKIAWNTLTSRIIKLKYFSSSSQSNEGLILPPNGNLYQQNLKLLGGAQPNLISTYIVTLDYRNILEQTKSATHLKDF